MGDGVAHLRLTDVLQPGRDVSHLSGLQLSVPRSGLGRNTPTSRQSSTWPVAIIRILSPDW